MSVKAYNGEERDLEWNELEERLGSNLEIVQYLDDVRYADGVDYKHAEHAKRDARRKEEAREQVEQSYEKHERAEQLLEQIDLEDLDDSNRSIIQQLESTVDSSADNLERAEQNIEEHGQSFEGERVKYDGKTESGPGTIIVNVDGNAHRMSQYSGTRISEDIWNDVAPENVADIDPQTLYNVMESADGALVFGREGFLPHTYKVPDRDIGEDEVPGNFPDHAGTKHLAALQAVYSDIKDYYGEDVDVTATVLSETDGKIRHFDDHGMVEFDYNAESRPRVKEEEFEGNNVAEEKELDDLLEPAEVR